jgi:hypothetical protein
MSIAVPTFLTAALAEIRVARAGDVVNPEDMDLALTLFNELLDSYNGDDGPAIYTRMFATFTLTPNLQPHTIGLAANTPTFSVSVGRPTSIEGANIVLSSGVRTPLNIQDDDWWLNVRVRALTASIPTDLYYSPDWPNGSIYLWPVPTTAYSLEIETSTLLAAVALTDTLDLPFGYQAALRLTLAELLAPAFGQTVSQDTMRAARAARERIFSTNYEVPDLDTRDAGMPGGAMSGTWDYRTGFSK